MSVYRRAEYGPDLVRVSTRVDGRPAARVVLSDGHKVVTGATGVRVIDIVNERGENKPIKDPTTVAARVEAARGVARASIAEVPARACGRL